MENSTTPPQNPNQWTTKALEEAKPFVRQYVEKVREFKDKVATKYVNMPVTDQKSFDEFEKGSVEVHYAEEIFRFAQLLELDLEDTINGQ
jgi:hypothetical protein